LSVCRITILGCSSSEESLEDGEIKNIDLVTHVS